jgi:hypothetical protein
MTPWGLKAEVGGRQLLCLAAVQVGLLVLSGLHLVQQHCIIICLSMPCLDLDLQPRIICLKVGYQSMLCLKVVYCSMVCLKVVCLNVP